MPLKRAVELNNLSVVNFLLESGVLPKEEEHLLHIAVSNNYFSLCKILLPLCDINAQDARGNTALHYASSISIAKMLVNYGASVDLRNKDELFPYETVDNKECQDFLKEEYFKLHPQILVPNVIRNERVSATDWANRFTQEVVTIQDLVPSSEKSESQSYWTLKCFDQEYSVTPRFVSSLAKKLKFSKTIFDFFSPQEVLERATEVQPEQEFIATFDNRTNQILGIGERNKKLLPPSVACRIFSEDPRLKSAHYENGIWHGELQLDEVFNIENSGEYTRKLNIQYPVDGIGTPCIYLAIERQVCSNGAVVQVAAFRTEIEVNDESGTHLSRLLRSLNNQYGFSALEERICIAQQTNASVNELMSVDNLLQEYVLDKDSYYKLHNRLYEMAGDPCFTYETTSLNNIPAKKRVLLPVNCAVNDLLNFCSELTTHHGNLLTSSSAFDVATGRILASEFDLEGMYNINHKSPDFFLNDLQLSKSKTQEYFDQEQSTEVF